MNMNWDHITIIYFQSIKISNYSLADKHIIVDYLDRVIKYTDAIIKNYQTIRQDIKGLDNKLTLDQHRSLIHTLYYMLSHNQINIKKSKEVSELFSVVTNYIELRKKQIKLTSELDLRFENYEHIDNTYLKTYKSNSWFKNLFYKSKLIKYIKPYYKNMQFNKKSIINDLQRVEQFMNQKNKTSHN